MPFKFENLEVWHLAVEYIDRIYTLSDQLPREEDFNLKSQIRRAATSIALNIAEGSTGQTDAEQARFLGFAIRSLIETVACQHLIKRRNYAVDPEQLQTAYRESDILSRKLQAMRRSITPAQAQARWAREAEVAYNEGDE